MRVTIIIEKKVSKSKVLSPLRIYQASLLLSCVHPRKLGMFERGVFFY